MTDYLTLVKEKEEEQRALDERMQVDADLLYLKKYVMVDSNKVAVPDIINITLNKPAVFAANVISALGNVTQQTNVESEYEELDTHEIEDFQTAIFEAADLKLQKQPGLSLLNSFADDQLCLRGRTGRRVLVRMENGILIPDIYPWDGRYIYYEMGTEGLIWAGYKTLRSKAQIQSEYGIKTTAKEEAVLDVWDSERNEVWVGNNLVKEQAHSYGFTPVVIQIVSLGYGTSLLDKNRIAHEGESIFFLFRDLIPELNRLASILATLNLKAVKPPMKQKRKGGGVPSEYDDVTDMATITAMDVAEDIAPIDYGDAKRAAEMLFSIMSTAIQEGSLSSIDLGNLQFPLSAVALVQLGEGRDQVFMPRLQAKALLNKATAEMFTQQVLQLGGVVEVGVPGHKKRFDTRKLEGEYSISYKYITKSPKMDIARMAVASQAEKFYDIETILKDILLVEDWEGVMRKRYYYLAEQVDPLVMRHRLIMNALKMAQKGDMNAAREARLMAATIRQTLAQIQAGQVPGMPAMSETKAAKPLLPLLGEGGQVGGIPTSAQRSQEIQKTPQEEIPK